MERHWKFGRFVVTTDGLTHDGRAVRLPPKPLGVLQLLVSRPIELVSKAAMVSSVWNGAAASDESLARSVCTLRRALEEREPGGGRRVETLYGRGYRFVGDVTAVDSGRPADRDPALPAFARATLLARLGRDSGCTATAACLALLEALAREDRASLERALAVVAAADSLHTVPTPR